MATIGQKIGFEGDRLWQHKDSGPLQKEHHAGVSTYKGFIANLMVLVGRAERIVVNGTEYVVGTDSLKKFAFRHMEDKPKEWKSIKIGDALVVVRKTTGATVMTKSAKITVDTLKEIIANAKQAGAKVDDAKANRTLNLPGSQPLSPQQVTEVIKAIDTANVPEAANLAKEAQREDVIKQAEKSHEEAAKPAQKWMPAQSQPTGRASSPVPSASAAQVSARRGSSPASVAQPAAQPKLIDLLAEVKALKLSGNDNADKLANFVKNHEKLLNSLKDAPKERQKEVALLLMGKIQGLDVSVQQRAVREFEQTMRDVFRTSKQPELSRLRETFTLLVNYSKQK